jgi:hypothetical protein
MAVPSWAKTLGSAAGTGIVAGAGQLGIAYGLGVVRWDTDLAGGAWHWQLTWLALLASTAVIAGAAVGRWMADRSPAQAGLPIRITVTLAGAVGAAIMIPLVLHPARGAHISEPGNPALTAVIATAAGLAVGVLAALAVLRIPTVAGNLVATVTWLWLAALGSAVWTIGRGGTWGVARPGLIPASGAWIPVLLLGVPALIALAVAALARFGGSGPVAVAVSGVAGPALLAAAYVIGAPGGGTETTAYRYALLSVAVAAAVSVLVAVARRPAPSQERRSAEPTDSWQPTESGQPAESGQPTEPSPPAPLALETAAWPETAPPQPTASAPSRPAAPSQPAAPAPETTKPPRAPRKAAKRGTAKQKAAEPTQAVKEPVAAQPGAHRQPARLDLPEDVPPKGAGKEPVQEEQPAKRRGGRRRRGDDAGPRMSAGESDYDDWLKALGSSGPRSD